MVITMRLKDCLPVSPLGSIARAIAILLLPITVHSITKGQNDLVDLPVPNTTEELASMEIDPAVKVGLFASDPDITKPIHFNFGPDGKLWVATSSTYPQLLPGETASDKIVVLEDTDQDGVADKNTVFADGLLIPTGVLPDLPNDKGIGAYVAASTQLLYFLDTDRDGRADTKRVVLSGFGTEDTHHLLHTLRWGPDGCIYMNQSIYIHSHIETPFGTKTLNGGGIWRFDPRTQKLDIVCKGFVNPWGHIFNDEGQSFVTDGAYNEGINHIFPGSVFATSPGAKRWLSGMNPGSPKHSGLEILSSDGIPDRYRNDLITSDFRAHRVNRFKVIKTDDGYQSIQQPDLIRSRHRAFRPIDAKMGPDGALYIADWYNPIIQHGEVDFRDPRRDRTHGRIWRVEWKDKSTQASKSDLKGVELRTVSDWINELESASSATRDWATLALSRNDWEVVKPLLSKWVEGTSTAAVKERRQLTLGRISAAAHEWSDVFVEPIIHASDPSVRSSVIRLLGYQSPKSKVIKAAIESGVTDDDWVVRLEAIAALGSDEVEISNENQLAMQVFDKPMNAASSDDCR